MDSSYSRTLDSIMGKTSPLESTKTLRNTRNPQGEIQKQNKVWPVWGLIAKLIGINLYFAT